MAQSWPWQHGLNRPRSAARLSERVRLYEALTEAQTSLAQFSGLPLRPHKQRWWATLFPWGQRAASGLLKVWQQGLAAWAGRVERWRGSQTQFSFAAGTTARPALSLRPRPRFLAHAGLLLLLAVLFLGGGFRGALAQPVQSNQRGGDLGGQWYWMTDGSAGVNSVYASVPALPFAIQHPRPSLKEALPEETGQPAAAVQRTEPITYTVQSGDTLISIAVQYDVSIETLYWFNSLKSADLLSIDQKLRIPPVDGLVYKVEAGDTLDSIAEDFKVRKGNMIAFAANNLREPYDLVEGQELFIPGASKPIPRPPTAPSGRPVRLSAPAYASLPGGERFSWPTTGHISDYFGWTGRRWHNAIDIATAWGTPIRAAAAGTVTKAGWESGYGYMVEINHGDGWTTRYGHMAQQPEVSVNQWVERGQLIGFIGCTGNCTGPHVHFEIRYNGDPCNPLDYLP